MTDSLRVEHDMIGWLKGGIRRTATRLGVEVRRHTGYNSYTQIRQTLLTRLAIDMVIDVGANRGQYGRELRQEGYRGAIVSFEPQAAAYKALVRTSRRDPKWSCRCLALGSRAEAVSLRRSQNSVSSSIRSATGSMITAFPEAVVSAIEEINVERLDSMAPQILAQGQRVLLKMDVQGYEDEVLEGSVGLQSNILVVETELALTELYTGQVLMCGMLERLELAGYVVAAIAPNTLDIPNLRLLEVNALLVRQGRSNDSGKSVAFSARREADKHPS